MFLINISWLPETPLYDFMTMTNNIKIVAICKWAHLLWHSFGAQIQPLHKWPSPHSNMLMSEVKAEAVPCLQVSFVLYKHMHISYHHLLVTC